MQWYYALNGQRLGPVPQAELERLVATGVVTSQTLVWTQGMAEWQPYATVSGGSAAAGAPAVDDGTEMCVVSGKRYPRREMINFEGKWISAEHRDEFFQRKREGVAQALAGGESAVPGPFGYGGFWRRFVAVIVDSIITGVVGAIAGGVIGALFGVTGKLVPMSGTFFLFQGILQLVGVAIGLTYEISFIRKFDATPGKMALGLKILRSDGSKLSVGRIVGRYFAKGLNLFTLLIGYIIAAFDDEKRGMHDRICDTRVVKTR